MVKDIKKIGGVISLKELVAPNYFQIEGEEDKLYVVYHDDKTNHHKIDELDLDTYIKKSLFRINFNPSEKVQLVEVTFEV
jgi:hypothetical protein